tara:strand:+ start:582 stop:839 length:258 start_codon:yes stop_codon:yes gene_type:complete
MQRIAIVGSGPDATKIVQALNQAEKSGKRIYVLIKPEPKFLPVPPICDKDIDLSINPKSNYLSLLKQKRISKGIHNINPRRYNTR